MNMGALPSEYSLECFTHLSKDNLPVVPVFTFIFFVLHFYSFTLMSFTTGIEVTRPINIKTFLINSNSLKFRWGLQLISKSILEDLPIEIILAANQSNHLMGSFGSFWWWSQHSQISISPLPIRSKVIKSHLKPYRQIDAKLPMMIMMVLLIIVIVMMVILMTKITKKHTNLMIF